MNPAGNYFLMYNPEYNCYYASETEVCITVNDAKLFQSLEEIIATTTIMKDWNWDYIIFQHLDGVGLRRIGDNVWLPIYNKWKEENPEAHSKLYDNVGGFVKASKL